MANGNLAKCLPVTLAYEGGWSDHPADPGGATMKGVTIGRYREHYPNATKADLRKISNADLQLIYRKDYWDKVRGEDLPYGVDLVTFDAGVNSGPSRGAKWLQAAVGAKQDGVVGLQTLRAVVLTDGKAVIQKLCAKRLSFVRALTTFKVFGTGWSRRIADVEARGVAMWVAKGKALSDANRKELAAEGDKAKATAAKQNSGAASAGGGGAATGGGAAVASSDVNWMLIIGLVILAVAVAGVLIVKARQNKDRAAAYAKVAAGA